MDIDLQPSPWEVVTYKLAIAIIDIGNNFNELHDVAGDYLNSYVASVKRASSTITAAMPYSMQPAYFVVVHYYLTTYIT
jgi:hypothetical protein